MKITKAMENEIEAKRLRIAAIGKEKSGKSRLAATGRKPVLFLDTDQRRDSVAGIKDVFAITYADPPWPKQPEGFPEMLDTLTALERGATVGQLIEGSKDERTPATVVLDSVSTTSNLIMSYELYSNKDLRREVSIGGKMTVFFPKSFDAWNAEMKTMESLVLRLLGLPMDVICIFHEAAEEAPDSTEEHPRYTGKVTPFPARHGRLLKYFNEVWRVERAGQIPTVQLAPNFFFTAATTLLVDRVEKPDISDLIRLHTEKMRQKEEPNQTAKLKGIS